MYPFWPHLALLDSRRLLLNPIVPCLALFGPVWPVLHFFSPKNHDKLITKDNPKKEDNAKKKTPKNEDNTKIKDDPKNGDQPKNKDNPKIVEGTQN